MTQDKTTRLHPHSRAAIPLVPVGHPDFKWTAGADVQATWRRYGWTPSSPQRQQEQAAS